MGAILVSIVDAKDNLEESLSNAKEVRFEAIMDCYSAITYPSDSDHSQGMVKLVLFRFQRDVFALPRSHKFGGQCPCNYTICILYNV